MLQSAADVQLVSAGRGTRRIVSADSHSARIWDPLTEEAFATIEPAKPVNDVLIWPESGLLMAACEAPRIEARPGLCLAGADSAASQSHAPVTLVEELADAGSLQAYFLPALGPAPRWSAFLENLTEELEESAAPTLYEDYRHAPAPSPGVTNAADACRLTRAACC